MRPDQQRCVVLAVANFKGGVSKTTTTMCLAQGLALRGHRVLAIDADPQASLTTLFGLLPEFDIPVERTLEPLFSGDKPDVLEAIDATYWNGLDLIAAGIGLYGAEFSLVAGSAGRDFWNALSRGLAPVLDDYDIILIDTPPSLSNITINALWAADGVLVPVPPSALDFASSVQFWKLLVEVGESLDPRGPPKEFEFFHILASRVDANDPSTASVRSWLQLAYAGMVLPVEVPRTIVTSNASVEFATVYDVETYAGAAKTYRRAVDAYDELVRHVEDSIVATWSARATRRA
jgi:chromosome partitioning protein